MLSLKRKLFDEYDGFADKRIKKLESGSIFIADDRTTGDQGADKQLFLWFCRIFVEVTSESAVTVSLMGGIPLSAEVRAWISKNDFEFTEAPQPRLLLPLMPSRESKLRELASLFKQIVLPTKHYAVPAYKYVCPRTAHSLTRLANVLSATWSEQN